MKNTNLVSAIIYSILYLTIIFLVLFFGGEGTVINLIGIFIFILPVIVNWISWLSLKQKKNLDIIRSINLYVALHYLFLLLIAFIASIGRLIMIYGGIYNALSALINFKPLTSTVIIILIILPPTIINGLTWNKLRKISEDKLL